MSDYTSVQKGSLKLKGTAGHSIKKKKKKKKNKDKEEMILEQVGDTPGPSTPKVDKRTKAERAYQKAREKRDGEEIIKKASKTHKERIMEFNQHLDGLTEHFDIPKVSWTK